MRERTVADLRDGAERVLKFADLEQVYVANCEFRTLASSIDPPFKTDTLLALRGEQLPGRVEAWARYTTEAARDEGDDPVPVWKAIVECVAHFELEEDAPEFSEDDLEAFAVAIGAPTMHPFAREATQSLTSRSAYPAFTLGLLTPVLAMPDDYPVEFGDREPVEEPSEARGSSPA